MTYEWAAAIFYGSLLTVAMVGRGLVGWMRAWRREKHAKKLVERQHRT